MNLLTRLAKRYGAVSKPANGYWLFLKEGEGKSASGKPLTNITIKPHQVTTWQCRFSSRNDVRRVVVTYHDVESGDCLSFFLSQITPLEMEIILYL